MVKHMRVIPGLVLLLGLGACEQFTPGLTTSLVSTGPGFGNTMQHNWAVQVVNPEGENADVPPVMDGHRAASAIDRYEKGKVFKPEVITTTGGVIGGGGAK